ncbi:DUF6620 family protein [Aquimarina aquimarini]|uniref:DUF6620 family protein n=1 Tax=Aquimarina aquimarini TaxID=1191734 RepID=UPI00131F3E22|nr:DUF6620 family protein [Aquimarina aquimarini]
MNTINELYQDVSGQQKEDYRDYILTISRMDWENYDFNTWPGADLSYPDLDEDVNYDVWPFKPNLDEPHWINLNDIASGISRYGYANRLEMPDEIVGLDHEEAKKIFEGIKGIQNSHPEEFSTQINTYGFTDENHFLWATLALESSEEQAYEAADALLREATDKLNAEMDAQIEAAESGGLLDPISGIDMQTWAAANAKIAGGMDLEEVLKIIGTEKPIWDEVSAEWNARMSQDTTYAIVKVYGDAFTNSDIGLFAQTNADQQTSTDAITGDSALDKVKEDFELYIKIMCHQSMGSTQGKDAASILQEYGLSVSDWGMVGAHWTPKMATDTRMAQKMGEYMEKYNAEFASAKAGDDIDF